MRKQDDRLGALVVPDKYCGNAFQRSTEGVLSQPSSAKGEEYRKAEAPVTQVVLAPRLVKVERQSDQRLQQGRTEKSAGVDDAGGHARERGRIHLLAQDQTRVIAENEAPVSANKPRETATGNCPPQSQGSQHST